LAERERPGITPRGRCRATTDASPGQALVEGALAFVLLALVALALVQFALFVHAQNVVTGAVQDGARVASAHDGSLDRGVAHARALVDAGLGAEAAAVTVTGSADGGSVTVEARGSLRLIIPWVGDARVPLRARAVSQKEVFRVGR
jgi:Flp pilus assembly protein TadG